MQRTRRVLVVADSIALCRAIARVLEQSGYLVDIADSLELARRFDESTSYVAALVDVDLRDGDAIEFARKSHAPVVAMTDSPSFRPPLGTRIRAILHKPFGRVPLDEILARLQMN